MKDGLSSRRVLSISQGNQGYMWILTHKGVDRFDGKNFKHYQLTKDGNIVNFFPNLNILSTDEEKQLWEVGKDGYVFKYDKMKDSFGIVFDMKNTYPQYTDLPISAFCIARNKILMACENNVVIYDTENNSHKCITKITDENISYITEAKNDGEYFFASKRHIYQTKLDVNKTLSEKDAILDDLGLIDYVYYHRDTEYLVINTLTDGLYVYDTTKSEIFNVGKILTDVSINIIKPYGNSGYEVLIATDGDGVYKLNLKDKTFRSFLAEDYSRLNRMNGSIIKDLCIDNDGRIWNVIYPTGITIYTEKYQPYEWIRHSKDNSNSLIDNRINAIMTDSDSDVWFATSNGISCYDRSEKKWINYLSAFTKDSKNDNHIFTSLCEYKPGEILAGGYMSGIYRISKHNRNAFYAIKFATSDDDETPDKYIRSILRDSDNILWGGGFRSLRAYNEKNKRTSIYPTTYPITCIKERDRTSLWIGTINGLYIFRKKDERLEKFKTQQEAGCINALCITKDRNYTFVGTYGNGLFIIDNISGNVRHYTTGNCSLITNNIYSIVENKFGDIILGTENGISLFSVKENKFTNWTGEQGLATYNFNQGAAVNTGYGEIILGSNEGAIVLSDSMQLPGRFSSHMVLDNLSIMYRPAYPGEKDSPLKKMLNETSLLELDYDQNTFSINVSSVNYDNPSNIYYTWKLEGFFDEWSTPSEDGMIRYTNISPGEYKLRIRAILLDNNQLLEERSISIIINSPLWLTPWAVMLYVIFVCGAAFSLYRYKMIKKDRRISQEKINFFIHTAHDIRTPLTLIKAPLGEILKKEKLSEEGTMNINLALQNTDNLSELANKLMNFQKEELYSPQVNVRKYKLNEYLKEYLQQFKNYAQQQGVTLEYKTEFDELEVWIDRNKMDSILRNLISNALKYTPKGGTVNINTSHNRKNWNIDITDTGIGIPKKDQKKLFKYMFRGHNATNQLITGSGIGMLLTWRLIQNHEGRISFSSEENSGTSFQLSFPIKSAKYIYRDDNSIEIQETPVQDGWAYTIASQNEVIHNDIETPTKILPENAPHILIVEDNDVLRKFLIQSLTDMYHVSDAENGKEALDIIRKVQPDLIISDVMMPIMNGHELCKAVKGNMATSHIPFIMLTALGEKKDIIDGLKTKADLYIVKPFDITLLKANISNVLENRDLVRKRLQELIVSLPEQKSSNQDNDKSNAEKNIPEMNSSLDEEFIRKVTGLIKEGLGNGLNVDTLCASVNMSRTSFYNKIKALTGEPPAELIRNIRMKEAAILLKTQEYTVSEVSDKLGFADPKYFADTFKKYYGVPPRDYMKSINNER